MEDLPHWPSGAPDSATPTSIDPCPDPGDWALLLAAQPRAAQFDKVGALLSHAAACRSCAQRLRTLAADPTPEESALLESLSSATPEGQRRIAVEMARTPRHSSASRAARLYLWTGAGLAASLLITLGLVAWWRVANNPERMLAEAYASNRIFDLRMPGANFSDVTPQRHLRGGNAVRESSRLLEARSRIEGKLDAAPEDEHWLQLEARADILEEKFDPAIDILDRLIAAGPPTAALLLDDASAYFQRGAATGSENDRATALDNLRRADELAPSDTVILFNEAVAMEDRGQLMNAVETWNRYLRFERDARWQAEGRTRLQALEQKLNQLKTHQSRMDQYLSTPEAMRALAANPARLATNDEELSSTLLPRLLDFAFPIPAATDPAPVKGTGFSPYIKAAKRSRASAPEGNPSKPLPDNPTANARASPCLEPCPSARTLLYALAASLQRHHNDPWLTQLLPAPSSPENPNFPPAAHALADSIAANVHGDYLTGADRAQQAAHLFHALNNPAGELRAAIEQADALQATANYAACFGIAHPLAGKDPNLIWIETQAQALAAYCDPAPGSDVEDNPAFLSAQTLAHNRAYTLSELRIRNMRGGAAVDAGDAESAWRDYLATIRQFYAGDYPALRLSGTLSGLEQVEQSTPRSRLALLLQREAVATLELTENRKLLATARLNLAAAAIRADSIDEARAAMYTAQRDLAANGESKSVESIQAEVETALANAYLERRQPTEAAKLLDAASTHMAAEPNAVRLRNYAVARGQLALEQGHPESAEPILREAILEQERLAGAGGPDNGASGPQNIVHAQQNRDLYAVLAGIWLAEGRSGIQVLALWERYRLRILGIPVPACSGKSAESLACLQNKFKIALNRPEFGNLLGQIVLPDRLLLYRATSSGVVWTQVPVRREDVLTAAAQLDRAVNSPQTPLQAVARAQRRMGELLIDPTGTGNQSAHLLLEADPMLGNLPWPAVASASGDLGLRTDLEESPSLLLTSTTNRQFVATGKALIVGASIAAGQSQLLPEVLTEARDVARFERNPTLLTGDQATERQIMAHLESAAVFHFAGHADGRGGDTRLLLAADGETHPWLDSAVFRAHPPRATRLAVFAACSSGQKQAAWNHGMGDIVSTLASIGVPDVVATRWQIDSAAAVPMMDAFYANLAAGQSVPQALTAARQSLLRDPRYRHPYYWAAWYASGSGQSSLTHIFQSPR